MQERIRIDVFEFEGSDLVLGLGAAGRAQDEVVERPALLRLEVLTRR
jgi:hypothetical protein